MKSWLGVNSKKALFPAVTHVPFFAPHFFRWLLQAFINESIDEISTRPILLLKGMQAYLYLDRQYRKKNLANFEGKYVFTVKGTSENAQGEKSLNSNPVSFSATFKNNDMYVHDGPLEEWDVHITFEDAAGMRSFLFSEDEDMVNALLKDKVRTEGNLNYLYKFGLMARHLCEKSRTLVLKSRDIPGAGNKENNGGETKEDFDAAHRGY